MTNEEIIAELEGLRQRHHVSPDCWYTCPATNADPSYGVGETSCNDKADRGSTECDCGADEANARLDRVIAALREGA